MSDEALIQKFVARFEKKRAPAPDPGPDLTLDDLITLTEELVDVLAPLATPEMTKEERVSLRGRRLLDMPAPMCETAEGLRACPDIQGRLKTAPEVFEHLADQDITLGSLIQVLHALREGADQGALLRAGEA